MNQPPPPQNPNYNDPAQPGGGYGQGFSQPLTAPAQPPSYTEATHPDQKGCPQPGVYPQPGPYPQPNMYHNPPPNPYLPPTQPMMQRQPVIGQTTVIVNQPMRLGPNPASMICPHCQQPIITRTMQTAGGYACFVAAILCIFGLGLCAFIPFLLPDCQDTNHSCPLCKRAVGRFSRM